MTLAVLDPGLCSLVVDFGRPRSRSLGVPVGGAADRTSLAVGNALVGNPPDAPAVEVTLAGPTVQAAVPLACVVYGAPFDLRSDRQRLRVGTTFTLEPGETLAVGGTRSGARAYLCVRGGFHTKAILGSRSGLEPLKKGDGLACDPGRIGRHLVRIEWRWDTNASTPDAITLRFIDGPQADWFAGNALAHHERRPPPEFTVDRASDRMGTRLNVRPPLAVPGRELVSEPVCPGSVQVTSDGRCIILGVDGQTIGGYPKVAQVISADLDALGQFRPGDAVRFRRVTLDEAERLAAVKQAEIRSWCARIRAAVGGR